MKLSASNIEIVQKGSLLYNDQYSLLVLSWRHSLRNAWEGSVRDLNGKKEGQLGLMIQEDGKLVTLLVLDGVKYQIEPVDWTVTTLYNKNMESILGLSN